MKTLFAKVAATMLVGLVGSGASADTWNTFVIRNGSSSNTAPLIKDVTVSGTPAKEFVISEASMKAGWGTSILDGKKVGDIASLSIQRLDNTTRFAAGSGPATGPYLNMWITNGSGSFAVIANEPSNAEWAGNPWSMTWDTLKSKTLKVFETNDKGWLPNSGVGLKFQDVANFQIMAPSAVSLSTGWSGLGGGAPRELSTNAAYGINWVFGDTLSNYVSGDQGYVVANPNVQATNAEAVPEPASIMLGIMGLGSIAGFRKLRRN